MTNHYSRESERNGPGEGFSQETVTLAAKCLGHLVCFVCFNVSGIVCKHLICYSDIKFNRSLALNKSDEGDKWRTHRGYKFASTAKRMFEKIEASTNKAIDAAAICGFSFSFCLCGI